jgi:hypothetical protein
LDLEKNRNLHKSQNKSRKLCEMATRIISDDELRYRLLQFYEDIPPIVEATRPVLLAKLEAKNISQNVGDSQIFKEKKLEKRNETVQQRPEERGERTKSEKRPPQVNASDDSTKFQTLVFFDPRSDWITKSDFTTKNYGIVDDCRKCGTFCRLGSTFGNL